MRLFFFVYFWYCEDLLIIPDLKYLYCDMNYLFNPCPTSFIFPKSLFLGFSNHPLECQRPIYKLCVKPHSSMTSQRCTRRSLPNYLDMTSYHFNVRQNILTWRWWMNDKITWRHARIVRTIFLRLFHWISIKLGQFVFFIVFQLLSAERFFFSNTRYWFEI
jgi:hypothetical protein